MWSKINDIASKIKSKVNPIHGISYQKMQHPVHDYRYRDVYNTLERKMGSNHMPTPKTSYYVGGGLFGLVLLVFTLWLFSTAWPVLTYGPLSRLFKMFGMIRVTPPSVGVIRMMDILFLMGGASKIFYLVNICADGVVAFYLSKMYKTQNLRNNPKILDRYNKHDSHIQAPEKLASTYDIFPDAGMHSSVNVSTLLAHIPLTNKGLKKIKIAKRYTRDTYVMDDFGHKILKRKGDYIRDENGNLEMETKPLIDTKFTQALLDTSFVPKAKKYRHLYNPSELKYNIRPDNSPGKQNQLYVSQHINHDWHMEPYEVQRPGGMYIVDTKPANTMVLAITRAGKGQTIIEPTIDMWTRMDNKANIVINDPKGELYVEFFYPATVRGYDVITFNLIDERHTNIYNPLGYAANASRRGDSKSAVDLVNDIGDTLFPADKADDPMWPNAANAAFKRSALGLIDYYQDEDYAMRDRAAREHWNQNILGIRLDKLWSHVNLNYVYQMMTQLASQRSGDIAKTDSDGNYIKDQNGNLTLGFISFSQDEAQQLISEKQSGGGSKDYLTLFFDAERHLPNNGLRTAVANQDNNLRSMAKSEKTLASVYGISLTAMNFFTDDAIAGLTSGRPSQNFDMTSLGFPRRIEVRFNAEYVHANALGESTFKWQAYKDREFKKPFKGNDFKYEGSLSVHNWASFIFKGIFPNNKAYIKLRLVTKDSELPLKVFYFMFIKGYQKSVSGRTFVYNPITHKRVISGGILIELKHLPHPKIIAPSGRKIKTSFVPGNTTFPRRDISLVDAGTNGKYTVNNDTIIRDDGGMKEHSSMYGHVVNRNVLAISQTSIHYTEKPKLVDFIMPPNEASYARIGLILYDQMFNTQTGKSYLTEPNQKPLYMTKYMLDELGNLKSNGKGIPHLQTKLSIGLGQNQQYTLILQTLQQLKDVYGEKADKIIQGNIAHLIFLKSTDDAMIDTLSKMSGTMHILSDSHGFQKDTKKVLGSNESKVSSNMSVKEVPVLTKNDFMLIPRDSSYVIGTGNPIVSMRQLALPMSWRLLKNTLHKPGAKYSLRTIPSTVDNSGFDELQNMPDFYKMVKHRVRQAKLAPKIRARYMEVHHYTDADMAKINKETLSRVLMRNINAQMEHDDKLVAEDKQKANSSNTDSDSDKTSDNGSSSDGGVSESSSSIEDHMDDDSYKDKNVEADHQGWNKVSDMNTKAIYANGWLSRADLCGTNSTGTKLYSDRPSHGEDLVLAQAYANSIAGFKNDKKHFSVTKGGSLYLASDYQHKTPLVASSSDNITYQKTLHNINKIAKNRKNAKISMMGSGGDTYASRYMITDAFIRFLVKQKTWTNFAGGQFNKEAEIATRQSYNS